MTANSYERCLVAPDATRSPRCSSSLTWRLGLRSRALTYTILGDHEAARQVHDRDVAEANRFNNLMSSGRRYTDDQMARAGALLGILMPAIPGLRVDFSAWRTAEYALLDQGLFASILLILNVAAIALAMMALIL